MSGVPYEARRLRHAEILRQAAEGIRRKQGIQVDLGRISQAEWGCWSRVAAWMEAEASIPGEPSGWALAAARAYLGVDA